MDKMKFETPDMTAENVDKIAALFPNCITEMKGEDGKIKRGINFELLKQMLSPYVVDGDECYEFTWVGKKASIVEANKPIRKTLRPCPEESKDWDTTENLYIEGDNLEVLKLLQESYLGKVKMIYIDPPYNTGSDKLIYPDNHTMDKEDYEEGIGLKDEEGNKLFAENPTSNPRFHSDWCGMIYQRLILAREFLADDGVIFISIDDNEQVNLRKICDEIYGASNFVAEFVWKCRNSLQHDEPLVSKQTERIVFYVKRKSLWKDESGYRLNRIRKPFDATEYKNPDNDPRGPWLSSGKTRNDGRPSYTVISPTGVSFTRPWVPSPAEFEKWDREGLIWWGKDGKSIPRKKSFLKDFKGNAISDILVDEYTDEVINENKLKRTKRWEIGTTESGTKGMKDIFDGSTYFDYPKPLTLIKYFARIATSHDSIILDFFSGSATTAHAVMQLNAEDGGHRKFIMVQLPEKCDEKSEAYKDGYKNICEIGKERIRRAGEKIKAENPLTTQDLDVGFRVLKLADSNMKDVYYAADDYKQSDLFDMISNIKDDRTDLDLLFGCLIDWGLPLSMPYTSEKIAGCIVHTYNNGDLIACFDENIPESVVKEIARRKPLRAVFRDSGFASSPAKINVFEIFKLYMPEDADDITKRVRVI